MKAMTIPQTGEPSVLTLTDLDRPTPGRQDLLIEVHAAAVNPVDTKLRSGKFRAPVDYPLVPGHDVSGVVREIGPEVTRFRPGDAVFAMPALFGPGSHADYVLVDQRIAARKPASLSHVQAAAIPLAAMTAWELLYDMVGLQAGQTVLIHAAAGGVGHFAVQLAKARDARVLGTSSSDDSFALLDELGIDHAINYRQEDVKDRVMQITKGRGCDAVLDLVGQDVFKPSIDLVAARGALGTIVGIPADAELNPLFLKGASLHAEFLGATELAGGVPEHQSAMLRELSAMVERGELKPHVSHTFTLDQLAEAHTLQETAGVTGKIVVQLRD